jgi:hypothetical protein
MMFTRWQKRMPESPASDETWAPEGADKVGKPAQHEIADLGSINKNATEVPAQRALFLQRARKLLGQLAGRIKLALRRSQALEEGLAERDRIPW